MWPVVRANTASAGAELELPLVEPVVLALELEPGSSIVATLPVTMRPTPPTVTVTSPRLAVAIVTSGVPADCPLCASQMETPISAAAASAVTASGRWGLREIKAGISSHLALAAPSAAGRRVRSR